METKIPLERAAAELNMTPTEVRQLIHSGRLALPLTLEAAVAYRERLLQLAGDKTAEQTRPRPTAPLRSPHPNRRSQSSDSASV